MAFASINQPAVNKKINIPVIEEAFAAEPLLKKRVYDAIGTVPQYTPLFEDIARHTTSLLARNVNTQSQHHTVPIDTKPPTSNDDGPAAKKRKLQNGDAPGTAAQSQSSLDVKAESSLQFYMPDISFAVPQRKKLTLEVTGGRGYLRARNQTSKEVEFGVPMDKIQHVLCLPVPEKNQKQANFCIIPQYSDGINPPPEGETASEAIVCTVNDGPLKAAYSGTGQPVAIGEGDTAEKLIRRILNDNLSQTKVIGPDEREFVSATPEAHRKGEKAYHVKAFRGSKEGYLFFLSTGILFGFKKPLVFFAFENIDSISYTSVLQRTFNLNIVARPTTSDETQELEFSMIDQADFSGIDTYIKTHGLQDASLAEARRAKRYNVNNVKTENGAEAGAAAGAAAGGEEEEESELQKAQRELEDQEDEDEEDYDPGSDGDSDGSGSSSEEDESDDEEGEDGGEDLVADELGSVAEDVPEDEL